MATTTITPRYQVHIPSAIRKQIGLVRHGRARISVEGTRIVIEPAVGGLLSLGGKFRVKNQVPAEKIRQKISYVEKKK